MNLSFTLTDLNFLDNGGGKTSTITNLIKLHNYLTISTFN